jgi:uncharacterized repeat protein (TIGR01451 family)
MSSENPRRGSMKRLTRSNPAKLITSLAMAAALFGAMPAEAQEDSGPLRIVAVNLTAQAENRAPPEGGGAPVSRPGDVIEYRLSFTNNTDGPVRDLVFDDPVPEGLVYVLGSAGAERDDVATQFSIDGGATYDPEPEIEVQEAGATVRRPAPAERYTHVRWIVAGAVSVGEQVQALFRARIAGGSS